MSESMVERLVTVLMEETRGFSYGSMDYEDTVRKLVAAMREPSPEMVETLKGKLLREDWLPAFLEHWRAASFGIIGAAVVTIGAWPVVSGLLMGIGVVGLLVCLASE